MDIILNIAIDVVSIAVSIFGIILIASGWSDCKVIADYPCTKEVSKYSSLGARILLVFIGLLLVVVVPTIFLNQLLLVIIFVVDVLLLLLVMRHYKKPKTCKE